MISLYDELSNGLTEAIDGLQGKQKLKISNVSIEPVKEYRSKDIKQLRMNVHMSQSVFAGYLGVSNKTVESWENGSLRPSGSARRLMMLLEMDKDFIYKYPFVSIRR